MDTYRLPELRDEFIYQLIFSMEDQGSVYCIDLQDGSIVPAGTPSRENDPDRFVDLPSWEPSDGFRIMEKFVATLRNPVFSQRLRESLSLGRGVFRQFKNVLKDEPAVERLWFYFKEREMKQVIYQWYDTVSDSLRLMQLSEEPEEDTSELILSDFIITYDPRRFKDELMSIGADQVYGEFSFLEHPLPDMFTREYRDIWRQMDDSWLMVFLESPSGDLAGCIGAQITEEQIFEVKLLYVVPRYRGLGVFSLLTDTLCRRAYETGALQLVMRISGKAALLDQPLENRGFALIEKRYALNLSRWSRESGK